MCPERVFQPDAVAPDADCEELRQTDLQPLPLVAA